MCGVAVAPGMNRYEPTDDMVRKYLVCGGVDDMTPGSSLATDAFLSALAPFPSGAEFLCAWKSA